MTQSEPGDIEKKKKMKGNIEGGKEYGKIKLLKLVQFEHTDHREKRNAYTDIKLSPCISHIYA